MNILMLGRWMPPPRRPVRATREYQFARYLARHHRLTLAFINDNSDTVGAISALRAEFGDLEFATVPRGWKSLGGAVSLATGESCTLSYFRSEALRTRLADRLRRARYDLVFVSSSSMIQYALEIDPTIPLMVDYGEIDSEWWLQQAARGTFPASRFFRAEATRLRMAEADAARRAVCCVSATPAADEIVRTFSSTTSTVVIRNGVDVEFFAACPRPGKELTILFNTLLRSEGDFRDGVEFCRGTLPLIRASIPGARFVVSSREPLESYREEVRLVGAEVVAPTIDLRPLLHSQTVAVAPLNAGTDIRSSLLEPMAGGIPVVTTAKGGDQVGARPGRDLIVADDPADFGLQVVRLLDSQSSREELGAGGRGLVQTRFSWDVIGARLEHVMTDAVRRGVAPASSSESRPISAGLGG